MGFVNDMGCISNNDFKLSMTNVIEQKLNKFKVSKKNYQPVFSTLLAETFEARVSEIENQQKFLAGLLLHWDGKFQGRARETFRLSMTEDILDGEKYETDYSEEYPMLSKWIRENLIGAIRDFLSKQGHGELSFAEQPELEQLLKNRKCLE